MPVCWSDCVDTHTQANRCNEQNDERKKEAIRFRSSRVVAHIFSPQPLLFFLPVLSFSIFFFLLTRTTNLWDLITFSAFKRISFVFRLMVWHFWYRIRHFIGFSKYFAGYRSWSQGSTSSFAIILIDSTVLKCCIFTHYYANMQRHRPKIFLNLTFVVWFWLQYIELTKDIQRNPRFLIKTSFIQ